MRKNLKRILLWMPRIAGILFVLFISIFAFDVFDEQLGFWGTFLALFLHLLPSILLTIAIVIAWKCEWFGAVMFIGWAVFYVATFRGFEWFAYALVAGLPVLIGLLFLAGWIWRRPIREG